MNELEMAKAVNRWLRELPGPVFANESTECLRKAWGMFGHGDLEMFRVALERESFRVEPLGDQFVLRLPAPPTPDPGLHRSRRIRNLM